jgi:sulfate permease, SulP family
VSYLPKAVLGSVIVSAAIGLVDVGAWRALRLVSRFELGIAAATLVGVVVLGVLHALVIAVALSILDVVRRSAQPRDAVLGCVDRLGRRGNVELHPSARVTPGVVVYRLADRLFFANARYVKGRVREALRGAPDEAHWLVFDAEAVSHVHATGLEALHELAVGLPRNGVALVVARMKPQVYERLVAGGVVEEIGEERFFPTVRSEVAACLDVESPRGGSPA